MNLRYAFLLIAAFSSPLGLTSAFAQSGTVTIVVPFTPGTVPDYLSRLLGDQLKDRIGHPVVTDNRAGASGNLGTFRVARAEPDGNTLLMTTASHVATNIQPFRKFDFDPATSFEPIILIAKSTLLLVVNNDVPVKSVAEFVAYGRSGASTLSYSSPGPMSLQHLVMEMFKLSTGIKATHVPYPGSAGAIRDVVASHVNAMFMPIDSALPLLADQKIRALAVASSRRSTLAPNISTLTEAGVDGFDVALWFGLLAPAGTPQTVVDRYNALSKEIFSQPRIREDFERRGLELVATSPKQFAGFIQDETQRWTKVIAGADLKPE